jgi:hypothetical protein
VETLTQSILGTVDQTVAQAEQVVAAAVQQIGTVRDQGAEQMKALKQQVAQRVESLKGQVEQGLTGLQQRLDAGIQGSLESMKSARDSAEQRLESTRSQLRGAMEKTRGSVDSALEKTQQSRSRLESTVTAQSEKALAAFREKAEQVKGNTTKQLDRVEEGASAARPQVLSPLEALEGKLQADTLTARPLELAEAQVSRSLDALGAQLRSLAG